MEKWIAKVVSGDPEAFQLLFAKKGYSVYKYALDYTGQRSIAKNVTKEVFNSFHKNLLQNHAEVWEENDLDQFLITRTRELCDSFQDLASIQGELFHSSAKPDSQRELYSGVLPEKSESLKEQKPYSSAQPAEPIASAAAAPHLTTNYSSTPYEGDTIRIEDISFHASEPVSKSVYPAEPITSREKIARLYDDSKAETHDEIEEEYKDPGFAQRFFSTLLIIFLILCVLGLFWVIAGIFMDIGWIPSLDLGYEWFNNNIYPLF